MSSLKWKRTKRIGVLAAWVLGVVGMASSASAQTSDWTDEWFNSATVSGPSSFNAQKRGYATGGQLSGRLQMTTDNVFSVSPPRISSSCGGIDLFAGGISYLDPEYLVQKLENILQAAPAMAFSMALDNYCAPCKNIMHEMENMSSFLNSIQVNDCRLANQLVEVVSAGDSRKWSDILEGTYSREALDKALKKNRTDAQEDAAANNHEPDIDLRPSIANCPAPVKDLLSSGSLVSAAASRSGMSDFADLIRGYVGDVYAEWPATSNAPVISRIDSCPDNDLRSLDDVIDGRSMMRGVGGACAANTSASVLSIVNDHMTSIVAKIATDTPFTADEEAFVNQAAFPTYIILRDAVVRDLRAETIVAWRRPLSAYYAYSVFSDLLWNIEWTIEKAINDASTYGVENAASPERCDMGPFMAAVDHLERLRIRVERARSFTREAYSAMLLEQANSAQVSTAIQSQADGDRSRYSGGTVN